jgi:hypothetical protein
VEEFFTAECNKNPLEEAKSPFITADEPKEGSSMNEEIFFASSKPENLDIIPSSCPICGGKYSASLKKVKKYVINYVENFVEKYGKEKRVKNRRQNNNIPPVFSTLTKTQKWRLKLL